MSSLSFPPFNPSLYLTGCPPEMLCPVAVTVKEQMKSFHKNTHRHLKVWKSTCLWFSSVQSLVSGESLPACEQQEEEADTAQPPSPLNQIGKDQATLLSEIERVLGKCSYGVKQ